MIAMNTVLVIIGIKNFAVLTLFVFNSVFAPEQSTSIFT